MPRREGCVEKREGCVQKIEKIEKIERGVPVQVVVDFEADPATVAVEEPSDCGRFHVAVRGRADAGALDEALRTNDAGVVDGDGEAMVRVDAVRHLVAGSVDEAWEAAFAAMLDYARSKGWLSEDGASIRAHVEWG